MGQHPQHSGRRHRLALDVARIEWAFVEAFDNAQNKPLSMDQIRALSGDSHLTLQPHVRLLALDHAAVDLVLALHRRQRRDSSEAGVRHDDSSETPQENLPRVSRRPAWVVAHRIDNSVYYRSLMREEFLTLTAIHSGWKRVLLALASRRPGGRRWLSSGLQTGQSLAGSARYPEQRASRRVLRRF